MKWPIRKVGEIAELCLGKMLDQKKNKGVLRPYLANVNVRWGGFELDGLREMRFEDRELERYGLRNGDIVMCEGGEPGRCAIWRDQIPGMMIQKALHRIRAKAGVDHVFLYYSFLQYGRTGYFEQYFTGSTIKHLPGEKLAMVEVTIPPLNVQRRIVSILSAYDDLIENNTRRIAVLEEMARRIYEEWFVRFRFPGHKGVRLVESELGPVPEGWVTVPASVAVEINPATKVPKEGLKPFIAMNCLSGRSMLIEQPAEREGNSGAKFRNGDTLFARITPCLENGKTGYVQFLPHNKATAFGSTEFIVLRSRTLTPEFVYLLARSEPFRENAIKSMSGASGRQRVREACFDAFLIAQPDIETLSRFEQCVRPMFKLVQSLALMNTNLRTTRDLLLPKLISGELDVSGLPAPESIAA